MSGFKELGVSGELVKGLKELKIITPSQIQKETIPQLLAGNTDLMAQAQTGTGKTAAFGIPLLQKVNPKEGNIQALVIAPTRELATQIQRQLFKFTKYVPSKIYTEVVYGGPRVDNQIARLQRTTHVLVATPGRLLDLLDRKVISLDYVKTLVLDEADEMLSMGFKKDLERIIKSVPIVKNKWLFSATMPHGVIEIANTHLSPNTIKIILSRKDTMNTKLQQQYIVCMDNEKLVTLMQFLKVKKQDRGVVFCRTKATAIYVMGQLAEKKLKVEGIHGDMLQKDRDKVMRQFKSGKINVLVATDIAARGIDVEGLNYVLHYELPDTDEYFVHRSGRTARAGRDGLSLSIVTTKEVMKLRGYEKRMGIHFTQVR